jgi:IS605 OrfB family transposase
LTRDRRELQRRRKRALGRVAVKLSQTGVTGNYASDNAKRFRYIRAIDHDTAHRISRHIVEFAREYGATIIVFEHLGHFKPEKGKYSKRGNGKRSYWLRGKIYRFTQHKEWAYRILTCRVSPRNTSRRCAGCASQSRASIWVKRRSNIGRARHSSCVSTASSAAMWTGT